MASGRERYEARDAAMPPADWRGNVYHPRHPVGQLFTANNRDVLVDALNALELDLEALRVLDVGCGAGRWLRELVDLGADPANLVGVDVSPSRLALARRANPAISWQEIAEDGALPFEDASFDLVLQTVVFSSVLDADLRQRLAAEMQRVCRRHILWQDLQYAEAPHVKAFSRAEVAELFPGMRAVFERPCSPGYFRRWYRHPTLCLLLSRLTSRDCESVLLVLEQP